MCQYFLLRFWKENIDTTQYYYHHYDHQTDNHYHHHQHHEDYNHLVPFLLLPSKRLLEEIRRHLISEVVLQTERKMIEDQITFRQSS